MTQRLRYANCGHLARLLLRSDGSLERLGSRCTVLGLFKDWNCAVAERYLLPGDTLALFTDGVTESFNREGEKFGERRLIEALRQRCELPSRTLLAPLIDGLRRFSPHEHTTISLWLSPGAETAVKLTGPYASCQMLPPHHHLAKDRLSGRLGSPESFSGIHPLLHLFLNAPRLL